MKQNWKNRKAVSPVIATILMVAITVVLAAVLIVYMQSMITPPESQTAEVKIDNTFRLNSDNTCNWTLSITSAPSGGFAVADLSWQAKNATTQMMGKMNPLSTPITNKFYYIDNSPTGDANGRFEAGDAMWFNGSFSSSELGGGLTALSHGDFIIIKKGDKQIAVVELK